MASEDGAGRGGLEARLGHDFARRELLARALTHSSHGADNNERLEFLGDALLGFVVADELYQRFPERREGDLSRLRSRLVRRESLAAVARELGLGANLLLGGPALDSGVRDSDSALADALEAILGAIHLDAGFDAARAAILHCFAGAMATLDPLVSLKDAKTELQEYLQARGGALPRYELLELVDQPHPPRSRVHCIVEGLAEPVVATGRSRRIAEQEAAREALARLQAGRNT